MFFSRKYYVDEERPAHFARDMRYLSDLHLRIKIVLESVGVGVIFISHQPTHTLIFYKSWLKKWQTKKLSREYM
jgi:hypothetical protein